jgi:methylenetetrahydrofolate dehydrogenase (NADP+)/methenyltetrahydrofolate cyclohydrolase
MLIDLLNDDAAVHGILVQLPLPRQIDADIVSERIDARKDVDGFYPYNMGRLLLKRPVLRPCSPSGCMRLLTETGEGLAGRRALVVGDSKLVARPMALELLMARCTVTACDSTARDLPDLARQADVLVAAVDKPRFIEGSWIKPGAIVIDAGVTRNAEGRLCGDVDFESARARAAWITPVPGGVGPMTVAMLTVNTLLAAYLQERA